MAFLEWVKDLSPTIAGLAVIIASHLHTGRVLRQAAKSTAETNQNALKINKDRLDHERYLDERKAQREALEKRLERGIASIEKLRELEWLAENAASNDDMRDVERDAEILQVRLRLAFGPSPFSVDYDHRGEPEDPDYTAAYAIDEIAEARRLGAREAPERAKMKVRTVLAGYQLELQTMQERLEGTSTRPASEDPQA